MKEGGGGVLLVTIKPHCCKNTKVHFWHLNTQRKKLKVHPTEVYTYPTLILSNKYYVFSHLCKIKFIHSYSSMLQQHLSHFFVSNLYYLNKFGQMIHDYPHTSPIEILLHLQHYLYLKSPKTE